MNEALRLLRERPHGGDLDVHFLDGREPTRRHVQPAAVAGIESGVLATFGATIEREGETVDRALSSTDTVLTLIGLVSAPVAATLISPAVQGALGDGWIAVFLATLTLCLGVTLSVAFVGYAGFRGMQTFYVFGACFVVSLFVANALAPETSRWRSPSAGPEPSSAGRGLRRSHALGDPCI